MKNYGSLKKVEEIVYSREMGDLKVIVIKRRGKGRWIIKKGWKKVGSKMDGEEMREDLEEEGIRGDVYSEKIGR